MSITDDDPKGYHAWYSLEWERLQNRQLDMSGRPNFVTLPIRTIQTPNGPKIRSRITFLSPKPISYLNRFVCPRTYLGKVL